MSALTTVNATLPSDDNTATKHFAVLHNAANKLDQDGSLTQRAQVKVQSVVLGEGKGGSIYKQRWRCSYSGVSTVTSSAPSNLFSMFHSTMIAVSSKWLPIRAAKKIL